MKNYDNILAKLYDVPWMITRPSFEMILSIVDKRINGEENLSEEELRTLSLDGGSNSAELQLPDSPSIAVLPITGTIFPKANLMSALSGATSSDKLTSDFNTLMESDMVTSIMLNVDSPGGSAEGIKEFADVVYAARQSGKKPIHAIANYSAQSAAYYIASQAEKFYMTDSGMVGSIGVIAIHTDLSAQDEEKGIKRTILTVGKHKADGNPYEPLSDSAKEHHMSQMQETYDQFVSDVARGRGTDVENVLENFGQGRSYKAKTAVKRGMVDGVQTLDAAISHLSESNATTSISIPVAISNTNHKGDKMELTPETLALLGLSEDATPDMVLTAITELKEKAEAPVTALSTSDSDVDPALASNPEYQELVSEVLRLKKKDRVGTAELFANKYAQFTTEKGTTGFGLSSIAISTVKDLHLKISDGMITHEDLESFLEMLQNNSAVVDYREVGSTRGADVDTTDDANEAAVKLRDLAYGKMKEDGLSYGDALSVVMKENPGLAEVYNNSSTGRRIVGGEN